MAETDLKEIDGLIDEDEDEEEPLDPSLQARIKKWARVVGPHVGLVIVVIVYALLGAWFFYSWESPNEDRLKLNGTATIKALRANLMSAMRDKNAVFRKNWQEDIERKLSNYNDQLYKAFKEQYVRYPDVRVRAPGEISSSEETSQEDSGRSRRHRQGKSRSRQNKMWTPASAIFFAATTMATIGYGNIVPVTATGRIGCVIFALIGAPLAIITIGDLGKFLSECTIWLYKRMKRGWAWCRQQLKRIRPNTKGEVIEDDDLQSKGSSKSTLNWDTFVIDKTEVPVILVFAILLLYIAFGGLLFTFLEDWSYMDAFYYSFISLTTIGFGDIVPENHDYIVIMLLYLGVGLAVTTMCIDLVGIQYIQKIHYFGRKFKGTDLLQLLKRKRAIERHLMRSGATNEQVMEVMKHVLDHIHEHEPPPILLTDRYEKVSLVQHTPSPSTPSAVWVEDEMVYQGPIRTDLPNSERVPSPTIMSIRSWRPPSRYSNSSASGRSLMFHRMRSRGDSWDESGPTLSEHCSLSTEPSVHMRVNYWDEYRSPEPSLESFKFDFPLPSPDYEKIALEAKKSRRIRSCPGSYAVPSPPNSLPSSSRSSTSTGSPVGLACMEEWDSYIRMLDESNRPFTRRAESSSSSEGPPAYDIDLGAFELVDSGLTAETILSNEDPVIFHRDMPVHSVHHDTVQTEAALENLMAAPERMLSNVVPPAMVDDNYCFVVDGDKIRMGDIMGDDQWWRHTSRPTKYFYSDDLKKFHRVNCITAKGKVISAVLASGSMSLDRAIQSPSMSSTPRSSMSGASSRTTGHSRADQVALEHVYKVIRFYSFWKTCTSFHRIVTMIDKVQAEGAQHPEFKKRLFVQYLWRNAKPVDKARVQREFDPRRQRLLRFVTDPQQRKQFPA